MKKKLKIKLMIYLVLAVASMSTGMLLTLNQDGTPAIKDYWVLDGKRYDYVNGTLMFPASEYGKFGVSVILVQRTVTH